jgi:hypothetical protein
VGADKANKEIQSLENSSVDLKDGVKGVGENFKSVGDLVRSQGGIMGDAFGTLGDSVIAVTDSVFVFKEGMATAGATGAKAWIGLLGPISAIVGAIALAVEAYRQFSGSSQEAEDNMENMAAAASDTASRLEAMVEAGIELSSDALREFIKVNEKARLAIEQVIKINEKRATSQLRVTQAEKDLNDAQKSTLFTETRVALAKSELISAQKEYNKLLDEQTAKSKEANKAQKESYELEQLITNELQFYIDEYQSQIDAQKDNLETTIKLTDAKNKDYLITLGTNTLQKQASEEILKATKVQKIYDDLLKRGAITQSAYDDVVKRNKQTLKEMTDNLKEVNNEQKNNLTLTEANVNLQRANDNQNKKAVVSTGSFTSAIDKRISKMEELTRIEKGYLANQSNQVKIETLLKETVLGGADAVQRKKEKEVSAISESMKARFEELKKSTKINVDQITNNENLLKSEIDTINAIKAKKQDAILALIGVLGDEKKFHIDFKNELKDDLLQIEQDRIDDIKYKEEELIGYYKNNINKDRKAVTEQNVSALFSIYKDYYSNVNDLNKIAYELELKDLNDQEAKLKLSKKKNKDELEQITKKKSLAEQTFISEQAKLQLQFEQDMTNNFIKIEMDKLNEVLKLKEDSANKEIIQLEMKAQKEQISRDSNLAKEINDYKKSRPAIYSLFFNENAKIEKLMEDFNKNQELKTLETEKAKIDIETKSIEERLSKLKEFTEETGKINQTIRDNARYLQEMPKFQKIEAQKSRWKKANEEYQELASTLGDVVDLFIELKEKEDGWLPPSGQTAQVNLIQEMMDSTKESLTPEILNRIDKYREKWSSLASTFEKESQKLSSLTGIEEINLTTGFNFGQISLPDDYANEYENALSQLTTLREKYNIDPSKNIEDQLSKLREGYSAEQEALSIALEQKKAIIDDYNLKINKSNEEKANKDIETQRQEYDTVRGYLYDMTDAYAQTASANIATAFYQGESIKEALKNTLQSLAIESTSKAIYETAAGLASLAIPGMQASAGLHFKAAAMYGSVALLAGVGTKLAPPSAGGSSTTSTSPTGNAQGSFNNRPSEDKGQTQNFYINFGGSVIYDTKASAERAMANRIMSLGTQSSRGQARSIQFRDR